MNDLSGKGASLQELARDLGLSRRSVAAALHGGGRSTVKVSEATVRRVRQRAAELGYRGNAAARAVATGRFNAVGLVLSTDSAKAAIPAATLHAIQQEMLARDMHLTLGQVPDEKLTSTGFMPLLLREWAVDGLIINYSSDIPSRMIELLRTHRLPSIWLNIDLPADAVRPDDEQAGRAAVEYLASLGHRRIAFVDHDGNRHYSGAARRAGYERAMRSAGLECRLIGCESHVPASARVERHLAWLGRPADQRPTAIVTYGEIDAYTAYVAALKLGLQVPRDLSIMTFHTGVPNAAGLPITSMRIPAYEVGHRAVQLLVDKINGNREPVPSVVLPFEFRPGQSTARPNRESSSS